MLVLVSFLVVELVVGVRLAVIVLEFAHVVCVETVARRPVETRLHRDETEGVMADFRGGMVVLVLFWLGW